MGVLKWAALAAVSVLACSGSASAGITLTSMLSQDYTFNPLMSPFSFEYDLIDDGRVYRWDFALTSADPDATVVVYGPDQFLTDYWVIGADGTLVHNQTTAIRDNYLFERYYAAPGLVSYLVWVQPGYDVCAFGGPVGFTCKVHHQVIGNGVFFKVVADSAVTVHATVTAVPEPATWAMMIAGFGLVGAGLRRRRRLVGQG